VQEIGIYAGLLTLLFIILSVRTLLLRRRLSIAIGDGDHEIMRRAMRVHANFAEYTPLGLILLMLLANVHSPTFGSVPTWLLHGLGSLLVIGRTLHALGVSRTRENFRFRVTGMAFTFTTLGASASYLLLSFFF
jgi:uncharacterized membrane protein YecN with MAPEG domain